MKIKEIKCPNCDANIKINDNESRGICEYCKGEFIFDDEPIKIEHTGTIEFNNDTALTIASTVLNKFKDYDKSLLLYKNLMYQYAYKDEIYIGLIRSFTKDFKINDITNYQLRKINEYWQKYLTLANDKDIKKYEKALNDLNKNYWYNHLLTITNNFNAKIKGKTINKIEESYTNYLKYCNKNDKDKLERKYKPYLQEYKLLINQINNKRKKIIKLFIYSTITILLIIITLLLLENPKMKIKSIKLSEFNEYYYKKNDSQYFEKYLKNNISKMKITNIKLNNEKKTIDITVSLKNILITKSKTFNLSVIDDTGPIITPTSCEFTDTDTINLYKCFTLYDFTDGNIHPEKAIINTNNIDFKTIGTKSISITAIDKDGNKNELNVPIIIKKTAIDLQFNLSENLIVGNTYNLAYNITPNNIYDTTVSYSYDENFLKINNNKITILKKGQTEICAISNYDNSKKQCKALKLELQCKDTYIFKFDGSKEEIITSNEVFCPGTYKIYATVMNKNDFYHLKITPKGNFAGDTLTIYKNSSFLNEEGKKYVLTDGYTIKTEIGITQVKLIKQK